MTVWSGRASSRTFKAARREIVPSAVSSPEQAMMPTFFSGSLGMGFLRRVRVRQGIDQGGQLLRQGPG